MAKKMAKVDSSKLDRSQIISKMKDRLARTQLLAINKVHPNPYNKNKMGAHYFAALKANIANPEIGFTMPILVRPNKEIEGEWEIIDGEHRYKACKDLGLDEIPAIDCGEMPEALLKYLMLEQNAVRGSTKDEDQKKVLQEIEEDPEWQEMMKDFDIWAATITEAPQDDSSKYDFEEDLDDADETLETTLTSLYLSDGQLAEYRKIIGQLRLAHGFSAEDAVMHCIRFFAEQTGFGGKTGDASLDQKDEEHDGEND
ncbi:MAG: ParB/RepB/Spo0J family partition protein [Pseudobdellovibrionaceae bacterium]